MRLVSGIVLLSLGMQIRWPYQALNSPRGSEGAPAELCCLLWDKEGQPSGQPSWPVSVADVFCSSSSLVCLQKSERSWWSSSNAWSSSRSRACSCCRTCRSSSAGRPRSSWSTPGAWRSWLNASPPRFAAPESTSSSKWVFPGANWCKMMGRGCCEH